jgi:hypothetical protein
MNKQKCLLAKKMNVLTNPGNPNKKYGNPNKKTRNL